MSFLAPNLFGLNQNWSLNCLDLELTSMVLTTSVFVSYCRFSRSMEVFSTSSLALTAFTVDASKSSAPLERMHTYKHIIILWFSVCLSMCLCMCDCVPGGQELCILQVQDHIQEVVTPKDSPLQQQETETDPIPDDPCLITWQLTLFAALLLRWRTWKVIQSNT